MVTILITVGVTIIAMCGAFVLYLRNHGKTEQYCITVRHAYGTRTKLTLNKEQYEQLKAWLNSPDGIYEIEGDKAGVWLDRRMLASVEMRR